MRYSIACLMLLSAGCVPIPYLTPPTHLSVDMYPNPNFTGEVGDEAELLSTNVAIGLAPMAAFPALKNRKFDVYGGLFLHSNEAAGPYLGIDFWPIVQQIGSKGSLRVGFTGRGALLQHNELLGTHYRAGLTAEILTHLKAKDGYLYQKDSRSIGILFGELGIGIDACMFVDSIGSTNLLGSMISVDFRIPTGAGVTFIPLERLKK